MKIILNFKYILFFLFVSIPATSYGGADFQIYGSGTIYKVSDGDTFWVNLDDRKVFDRLLEESGDQRHFNRKYASVKMRIGHINTAESDHFDESKNTEKGKSISNYVKRIAASKQAKFVCWEIGYYKRPICSVEVEGVGDIGAHLIGNGMANYITKYGKHPFFHDKYMSINN